MISAACSFQYLQLDNNHNCSRGTNIDKEIYIQYVFCLVIKKYLSIKIFLYSISFVIFHQLTTFFFNLTMPLQYNIKKNDRNEKYVLKKRPVPLYPVRKGRAKT